MKKLHNLKWFLLGMSTCVLLSILIIPAAATVAQKTATLNYNNIKITLDGKEIIPQNANGDYVEPFIIEGTTYLPVRGIASTLGLDVAWDDSTKTIKLSSTTYEPNVESYDKKNNPTAEEIKTAISSISDIGNIEIVTENNDPNGLLGKQGGYTGALFFDSPLVKIEEWFDDDYAEQSPTEKGTAGGGCIEIYGSIKDAETRDEYLASFDGSYLASYHKVFGTLVIRLSNSLKASEQNDLSQRIINALS